MIPDEAVEAAARVLLTMLGPRGVMLEDLNADDKAEELGEARRILEAAAPHMTQAAQAEAWQQGYEDGLKFASPRNPYRPSNAD